MPDNILITGATGLLAPYIVEATYARWNVITSSHNSGDYACDLTNEKKVKKLINVTKPKIVIHMAALTNVDYCQCNPKEAKEVNYYSSRNIKQAAEEKVRIIYLSTDQVYPDSIGPHKEGKEKPVNVYGMTKLEGEKEIIKHRNSVILRTNFFGQSKTINRASLSDFFISMFKANKQVTLFEDAKFSPIHMKTLGELIVKILDSNVEGVFNAGSRKGMSKAEFARFIAKHLNLSTGNAISSLAKKNKSRTVRAIDLRMDSSKLEQAINFQFPTLKQEIFKL